MLQKYFLPVMMLLSLSLISCRNGDDELNTEEEKNTTIFDKKMTDRSEAVNLELSKRDSLFNALSEEATDPPPTIPPIDGTHWRQKK